MRLFWFKDRSVTPLASGPLAILQDTEVKVRTDQIVIPKSNFNGLDSARGQR